jgi:hypothetical protein|tara:strand:+ start:261 stop:911 length:651 start_codon:yes stop_codon:yes gene_type:complete
MSEKTNPFLQPGNQFLAKYLSGIGAKPGKMSVLGIGLPEFGFTEKVVPTLFPNRDQYNKEVVKKNEELNKEGSIYGSNFPIVEKIASTISRAPQTIAEEIKEKKEQEKLPDSFNQDKYFKSMKNMMVTDSLLRDYELGRDANRQFAMMQKTLPLVDLYSQTAADRRLMEDRSSPTKISQQRLRAQTGEAALMNAIANQTSAAAQAGNIGTSRRYGR